MHAFKKGDVVHYYNSETCRWRVGIVVDPRKYTGCFIGDRLLAPKNVWAVFTYEDALKWHDNPTHANPELVEPHPDPDPIVADWVKWQMLGAKR